MATQDIYEIPPLYPGETEDAILDRWRGWANEGTDPIAQPDEWTDVRQGSHWWVSTTPPRREIARAYDLISEMMRAVFPQTSWGDYLDEHAELREIGRRTGTRAEGVVTFEGEPDTVVALGITVGVPPDEPDAEAPEFVTTAVTTIGVGGTGDAPIQATEIGLAGMVGPGAITSIISAAPGVTSVTNAAATVGGTELESDESLSGRVVESFSGSAVANVPYYRRLMLDVPGVGRVTVVPVGDGPGTVVIIIATDTGAPVSPSVLDEARALVSATQGQGAQTGAVVTVETSELLGIEISATIEFEPGWSLDGVGATVALRDPLTAALDGYVGLLSSGDEIVLQRVAAQMVSVTGVHDVGDVEINGDAANLTIPLSPPQTPSLLPPVFTEGVL